MNKDILDKLLKDIGQERLDHTLRVVKVAKKLANLHKIDVNKAATASLLHDCAKFKDKNNLLKLVNDFDIILDDMATNNLDLIHGPLGAHIARHKYKIEDQDILNSIKYHTTGRKDMSQLEKIVYLADYIEPKRKFSGLDKVRKLAYEDLDKGVRLAMDQTIIFLVNNKKIISIDTVEARNQLKIKEKYKE